MATQTGVIGGVSRRELVLFGLGILLAAAAVVMFYLIQRNTDRNQAWLDLSREVANFSRQLTQVSRETSQGLEPDARTLISLQDDFDYLQSTLKSGDAAEGLPALPDELQPSVDAMIQAWTEIQPSVDTITTNIEAYKRTVSNDVGISEAADRVRPLYEQITAKVRDRSANAGIVATIQLIRLERLVAAARTLTRFGPDPTVTVASVEGLAREFQRNHRALAETGLDAQTQELANAASTEFDNIVIAVQTLVEDAPGLKQFYDEASGFLGKATSVVTAAGTVEQGVLDFVARKKQNPAIAYFLGAGGLVLLLAFGYLFLRKVRGEALATAERDTKQQQAILELLDEITNLADGDLTVDVTVTEDFTGAIADSINYTVANMRNLVGQINVAAVEIAAAAGSTQETARKMNAASERQSREISSATQAVTQMSTSLQQVAGQAEQLATEAQSSVAVAHNGAATVGRTIQGMAALREQIQDTSKRIKRLGESSQEIGNITELINDIAEQTNTLALNASIQAAMAGEAGRGFAVVADEVQRLAERATNATRQIETLVRTIQADTNEAIISMERSTTNVVAGAKAAEEAGQALTKIETSSTELARLMQNIAVAARGQSAQGTKIASTMQLIRDIAVETAGSAARTAEAVGELNVLSEKLRESVSGFKLPTDIT